MQQLTEAERRRVEQILDRGTTDYERGLLAAYRRRTDDAAEIALIDEAASKGERK